MNKLFRAFTADSKVLTNDYKLPIWGNRYLIIPECSIQSDSRSEGIGMSDKDADYEPSNVCKVDFPETLRGSVECCGLYRAYEEV